MAEWIKACATDDIEDEDVIRFAGVTFKQTSTAPTVTISSNTYYNTYIFGDDAIFSVFLNSGDAAA